jgi:small subunit ribosomal protein S5e
MANAIMKHGRNAGKKLLAVRSLKQAFEIIFILTGKNPIQMLTNAIGNCGPREDSTRIGTGGVVRRQAVDVSPLRRVNQGIYLISQGARERSFRNIKTFSECLAEEIIYAGTNDIESSSALKKKYEIERIAKANR